MLAINGSTGKAHRLDLSPSARNPLYRKGANKGSFSKGAGAKHLRIFKQEILRPSAEVLSANSTTNAQNDKFFSSFCIPQGEREKKPAFTLAEGATHVDMFHDIRKSAFTLAEVLVTLGIIGIVAAMTIPTLITNYKKKVTAERVKQAYSLMYQAIRMSENDHENSKFWHIRMHPNGGLENTEAWLNYFIVPYFNNAVLCGIGNSTNSNTTEKCGHSVSGSAYTYRLQNGTIISIIPFSSFDGFEKYPNQYIMALTIDVNGVNNPNKLGTDIFYFMLYPDKGLVPVCDELSREELINGGSWESFGANYICECKYSKTNPYDSNELNRHGCTALLMMDGWEFRDDYAY